MCFSKTVQDLMHFIVLKATCMILTDWTFFFDFAVCVDFSLYVDYQSFNPFPFWAVVQFINWWWTGSYFFTKWAYFGIRLPTLNSDEPLIIGPISMLEWNWAWNGQNAAGCIKRNTERLRGSLNVPCWTQRSEHLQR